MSEQNEGDNNTKYMSFNIYVFEGSRHSEAALDHLSGMNENHDRCFSPPPDEAPLSFTSTCKHTRALRQRANIYTQHPASTAA